MIPQLGTNHTPQGTLPTLVLKPKMGGITIGGRPTKDEKWRQNIGEGVTKLSEDVLQKLRQAFAIDATVKEATKYAGISVATFYNWREKNPELMEELETFRVMPVLAMRQAAVTLGTSSYSSAMDYLSRKVPEEFGNKTRLEHSGGIATTPIEQTPATAAVAKKYEKEMKETIIAEAKKKA